MKIAICDDEAAAAEDLKQKLENAAPDQLINVFTSMDTFMSLSGECSYDVVFMDVDCKAVKSGISRAADLYIRCPKTQAFFVTGHGDRHLQRFFFFRSNLCGYLVKPVEPEILSHLMDEVQKNMTLHADAKFIIQNRGVTQAVPYSRILYFENRGHKAIACLQDKTYEINDSLESVRNVLPANFLTCHKSYSVNMDYIKLFTDSKIILANGAEVPVSRARATAAREQYARYTGQQA